MIHRIRTFFVRFWVHEDANAVTEYAVMLSLIVLVALGAIMALGTKMADVVFTAFNAIDGATS